jgi:hypothetical protein
LSGAAALTPWLGISGALSGAGALPRDVLSAALIGVDEALGLEVGVGLVLVKLRNVQITARGDFGFTNNRALQPNAPLGSIFTTDRSETLRPALIAAIAASPVLGFQASFSYMWQWFNTSEADVTRTISGGAAATVNFGPAPATLLVGIGVNHDSGAPLDVHNLRAVLGSGGTPVLGELGLYYTGRRDLDLGVVVSYQFTGDDDDRRVVGNLRLGYYF